MSVQKTFCCNCAHAEARHAGGVHYWADCLLTRKVVGDFVQGSRVKYTACRYINEHGDCPNFKKGTPREKGD